MSDLLSRINQSLETGAPALAAALSSLGRRIHFPPDIPFQAAQARGKAFNGTIGQITDGPGHALPLRAIDELLSGLDATTRNRALLYSPVEGIAELRQAWWRWQRRGVAPEAQASLPAATLPIVTDGLTHGLAILADLFGGAGRTVIAAAPFWGNYRQTFGARTGATLVAAPTFTPRGFETAGLAAALAALPAGEPAVVALNLPSNPSGYSLTAAERQAAIDLLVAAAERRPLVVICDDAYAGLVYEATISPRSLFWDLAGRHPQLLPIKVDGVTKELSLFGGRVGFLTFPFAPDSEVAAALESKVKGLLRATVGSPVSVSQMLVLVALADPRTADDVEALRQLLGERYRILKGALAAADPALLRPLPFNSGCFALVELPAGVEPEAARAHLLAHHDTGLVSIKPQALRIAFCSVQAEALPELVRRLERGVGELVARG